MPRQKPAPAPAPKQAAPVEVKKTVVTSATNPQELPAAESVILETMRRQYEAKQYKRALKGADQILEKFPKHGETLAMKGLIMNALKRKDEAYALVKQGLANNLKSFVCWHIYGLIYRSDNKFDDAIKSYTRALQFSPENMLILKDLAQLQIQRRNLAGFTETRRKILVLKASGGANWIAYAIGNHLCGNYAKALSVLDSYEKMDLEAKDSYERSELILYKNMIMRESGDFKQAIAHLDSHVRELKDPICRKEVKAEAFLGMNEYSQAEALYRELIALNPDCYTYHHGLMRAKRLHAPFGQHSEEQIAALKQVYQELSKQFPKCSAVARLPLDFLGGEDFKSAVDKYLRKALVRGIPSLFVDLCPLYKHSGKQQIVEDLVMAFSESLRLSSKFDNDSQPEDPSVFLWTLYFAGQHFDFLGNFFFNLNTSQLFCICFAACFYVGVFFFLLVCFFSFPCISCFFLVIIRLFLCLCLVLIYICSL
jgi:tetratricopeptide (TPR) repeat protein